MPQEDTTKQDSTAQQATESLKASPATIEQTPMQEAAPKPEQAPTQEAAPKPEQAPTQEAAPKPEQAPTQEAAPKPEQAPTQEAAPKPEQAPTQEAAPQPEQPPAQEAAPQPEQQASPADKKAELEEKLKQLQNSVVSANVPQLVMTSISYALDLGSSDIHIEALEDHVRVRYRVDGVLREIIEYPNNLHPAVVSRIKIMSNLKIDEQRLPQDGRADVTTKDGREMDLRISSLPTVNGEKIVMRIQDKSRKIPDLPDLGITGISLKNLESALASPNGIIINTGPTGSGKTTTLYSCLTRLNKKEVNILTIEDPVEIQLDGLNQSQVHHDIDYNFAMGMRAALRQDPDIVMVGEIRDKETANTAIEASLTGHLVFSTLHTNSAVESITRIINMGIQPYLITSTVELIIAQRLVRKVCEKCKKPAKTDDELLQLVKKSMENLHVEGEIAPDLLSKMQFFEAPGCEDCNNIGYKGRLGLYEVFRMNNELRNLIGESASALKIQEAAQKSGMVTLEQAGIIRALEGLTTLEEVYRVARKSE